MQRAQIVLSAQDVADYLFVKGQHCPFCGSEGMDSGTAQLDGHEAVVPVTCLRCRRTWQDVYRLADIIPDSP